MSKVKALPKRSQVPAEDCWNLASLYPTDKAWEKDFAAWSKQAGGYAKFRGKLFNNLENYGNTSGGSIPLALDEAFDQGRIRRGDQILISGYGAGLSWGTAILRW